MFSARYVIQRPAVCSVLRVPWPVFQSCGSSCHARFCTTWGGGASNSQPPGKGGRPGGIACGHGTACVFDCVCFCAAFVRSSAFFLAAAPPTCLFGSAAPFAPG